MILENHSTLGYQLAYLSKEFDLKLMGDEIPENVRELIFQSYNFSFGCMDLVHVSLPLR
jgi:hypothetical protein